MSQIGNRLTHIEKNIEYIKNVIFQSVNNSTPNYVYENSGQGETNNLFIPGNVEMTIPGQVATPNFKMTNEIKFENGIKNNGADSEKKESESEKRVEQKKEKKRFLAQESFDSFQEKQSTKNKEKSNRSLLDQKKSQKSSFRSSAKEKESQNSGEATVSDVILSANHLKSESERETDQASTQKKKSAEKKEQKKIQDQEKQKQTNWYKKSKRRGQRNRYGGYNRYKSRYRDDDHYHF